MVIMTAKLSKPKLIGIVCGAVAVIVLIITLSSRGAAARLQETSGRRNVKLETSEARVAFLEENGYTVAQEPVRIQEVRIPEVFSDVYEQYNAIQQSQGFDLGKYRGKTITQTVYQVLDYPGEGDEPVYATLLLYRNKLIGADLSRGGAENFLRPLLAA